MNRARLLRFACLALMAFAFTAGLVVLPSPASADRVRVRVGGHGSVRIRGQARVRVGGPRVVHGPRYRGPRYRAYRGHRGYRPIYRPYYRPHIYVRGYPRPYFYPGYYWGFRYAVPPPPPACYHECGPAVSAYYHAGPQPAAQVAAPAPDPLPRLGLGVFGGSVDVENNDAGTDLGLIGRLRLSTRFALEAEVSKTEIADGVRVDRRVGGALLFDFAPYSSLSPYVLGGGGFGQTEVDDGRFTAEQAYGELGVGLEWALGRHISLFGDLRAGVRETNATDDEILLLRRDVGPPVDDNERFTRARIGALLYF